MAFALEPGERPGEGVRRVAREQIDRALRDLDDPGLDEHATVHEVRKRCKKIRGLVRLVRPGLGDAYRAANRHFRDLARTLSAIRDATTLIETVDALADDPDAGIERDALAPLRAALDARRTARTAASGLPGRLAAFRAGLVEAREEVAGWVVEPARISTLGAGLRKTYARARDAARAARAEPSTGALHEWRKRAKYHRYHLRLLRRAWPGPLGAFRDEAKRLGDLLGDDHDLAVLADRVRDEPPLRAVVDGLAALEPAIAARRRRLQEEAFRLGDRLLCEKPKRLRARCEAYLLAAGYAT